MMKRRRRAAALAFPLLLAAQPDSVQAFAKTPTGTGAQTVRRHASSCLDASGASASWQGDDPVPNLSRGNERKCEKLFRAGFELMRCFHWYEIGRVLLCLVHFPKDLSGLRFITFHVLSCFSLFPCSLSRRLSSWRQSFLASWRASCAAGPDFRLRGGATDHPFVWPVHSEGASRRFDAASLHIKAEDGHCVATP